MQRTVLFTLGFGIYVIILAGVAFGAGQAYEAESASEVNIEFDGDEIVVGDNRTDYEFDCGNSTQTRGPVVEGLEDRIEEWGLVDSSQEPDPAACSRVEGITRGVLSFTLGVADVTASALYPIRGWIPAPIIKTLLNVGAILPLAGIGWAVVTDVQRLQRWW